MFWFCVPVFFQAQINSQQFRFEFHFFSKTNLFSTVLVWVSIIFQALINFQQFWLWVSIFLEQKSILNCFCLSFNFYSGWNSTARFALVVRRFYSLLDWFVTVGINESYVLLYTTYLWWNNLIKYEHCPLGCSKFITYINKTSHL